MQVSQTDGVTMGKTQFDVLTIGNAIVDVIANCSDDFLERENIVKAAMNLIDEERAEHLYKAMGPADESSGGSAANTAAGVASFGGNSAYIGKVADDDLGVFFGKDMNNTGVHFQTGPLVGAEATARSMIFVTPDGERSMNTYLGACTKLNTQDIDEKLVAASKIVFFEGYLWDPEEAKDAIRYAIEVAHASENLVGMSLSDPFCVDRYRDEFNDLIDTGAVDVVFGNEHEICSLYETEDLSKAVKDLQGRCNLAIITQGKNGTIVATSDSKIEVPAHQVKKVIDRTGAGDLFAAGFLYGMTSGRSLEDCAKLGGLAAAEVIQHIGARQQVSLKEYAKVNGF